MENFLMNIKTPKCLILSVLIVTQAACSSEQNSILMVNKNTTLDKPANDKSMVSQSTDGEIETLGGVTIVNRQLFNQYNVKFTPGMKWVYLFKTPEKDLSEDEKISDLLAQNPDGISLKDTLEVTVEIVSVDAEKNEMLVKRLTRDISNPKRERPVANAQFGNLAQDRFSNVLFLDDYFNINFAPENYEGKMVWARETTAGKVSVPAGNYDADILTFEGVVNKVPAQSKPYVERNNKIWMADGVGPVKFEGLVHNAPWPNSPSYGSVIIRKFVAELQSYTQ